MEIEKNEAIIEVKKVNKEVDRSRKAKGRRIKKRKPAYLKEKANKMEFEEKYFSRFTNKIEKAKLKYNEDLSFYLIQILKEENRELIKNIVKYYEQSRIIELLNESLTIYKTGGMVCKGDITKKRTFGGIFIKLVKDDITNNDESSLKKVFAKPIEKVRKRNQMKSRRRKERKRNMNLENEIKNPTEKKSSFNKFAALGTI